MHGADNRKDWGRDRDFSSQEGAFLEWGEYSTPLALSNLPLQESHVSMLLLLHLPRLEGKTEVKKLPRAWVAQSSV